MFAGVRRVVLVCVAAAALVGCQGVPADFKPDPSLKSAPVAKLQSKVADICVKSQLAKGSVSTAEVSKPCGCYAGRALKAMDKTEIEFYRTNGFFADSARPKAQAALEACGLKS